jgi:hypothetical protein
MSEDANATRTRMQKKTFTTWVNLHLKKTGTKIEDLKNGFEDGVSLIKLIEVISEDSLGKYKAEPKSRIHKVENINVALKYINGFLKAQGISNFYSAENVREPHARPPRPPHARAGRTRRRACAARAGADHRPKRDADPRHGRRKRSTRARRGASR